MYLVSILSHIGEFGLYRMIIRGNQMIVWCVRTYSMIWGPSGATRDQWCSCIPNEWSMAPCSTQIWFSFYAMVLIISWNLNIINWSFCGFEKTYHMVENVCHMAKKHVVCLYTMHNKSYIMWYASTMWYAPTSALV